MKIKISKEGHLYLEKKGIMKKQYCPYSSSSEIMTACGDWCPLFEEPIYDTNPYREDCKTHVELIICKTTFTCKEPDFTDER